MRTAGSDPLGPQNSIQVSEMRRAKKAEEVKSSQFSKKKIVYNVAENEGRFCQDSNQLCQKLLLSKVRTEILLLSLASRETTMTSEGLFY
jgi:hypothetical protein